jgi:hypothetical protein
MLLLLFEVGYADFILAQWFGSPSRSVNICGKGSADIVGDLGANGLGRRVVLNKKSDSVISSGSFRVTAILVRAAACQCKSANTAI